jgi:hypothetical protein
MRAAIQNSMAVSTFDVVSAGLLLEMCDADPRYSNMLKSPPVSSADTGKLLSIVISFPVGGLGVQFEVYSTSVFGTFDTLLTSFKSPKTDKSQSTTWTLQTTDLEYFVCLPQGSEYGITLTAAITANSTEKPVAIVRNITVTESTCIHIPPDDGEYVITEHFIWTEFLRCVP